MKVLLVSPATPDTFWSFKHVLSLISRKASFPPLGLLTVAGMLPREWDLRLVDLNTDKLADADLAWADYVFVSAMLVQAASAREVIARARKLDKPVVAGGPLFTTSYQQFPQVDACVLGEAELVIDSLIRDMRRGQLQKTYHCPERPDVKQTPLPRWDLIRMRNYLTMSLQFSRGCPFNCEFCDIIVMNGRTPRTKTPQQMIRELDSLVAAGWKDSVFIVDDNFIGNKVQAKALLRALVDWRKRRRVTTTFTTEVSLNVADDPELLTLLVEAGFKKLFIGIESPAEDSLQECAKIQNTRRDLVAAVNRIQAAGLEVMGGFIVGFDSDGPGIFEQQKRFIQQSGIAQAMVGLLTALPGTRLFQRLQEEGRIIREATGNNLDGVLNFLPKMDREALVRGYRSLVQQLYRPKPYYERILSFLSHYRPQGPRAHLSADEVRTFLKSLWVMGIWSRGRRAYWRFLAKVMLLHPRALGEAVTLAIAGHHFRMVASAL